MGVPFFPTANPYLRMVDKLRDYVATVSRAKSGDVTVNMVDWCGRATLDIIGSVGFGHDFQCGESPEAIAINASWAKIIALGMTFEAGFVAPLLLRPFPFIANLPLKAVEAQGEIRKIIRALALKIIQNREAAGEKPGKDLLSVLLQMKDNGVSFDELLDHVSHASVSVAPVSLILTARLQILCTTSCLIPM